MSKLELAKRKDSNPAFEYFVDCINNEIQPRTLNSPSRAPCEAISNIACGPNMQIDTSSLCLAMHRYISCVYSSFSHSIINWLFLPLSTLYKL